jgi:hypothetical protein
MMVGLDAFDALAVKHKAVSTSGSGYGFVPSRSFVGRVVESGFEVQNIVKGEWLFGLLDLSKVCF